MTDSPKNRLSPNAAKAVFTALLLLVLCLGACAEKPQVQAMGQYDLAIGGVVRR